MSSNKSDHQPILKIFDPTADVPDIQDPAIKFQFDLDIFQKQSFQCIERNENLLICAHTSSGKTVPAIYAIAYHLRRNKKVIYTAPIKTLSNQKYKEFKELFEKFSKEIGRDIIVGLLTGDNKINPNADILIMTAEILASALYKLPNSTSAADRFDIASDFLTTLGGVIMDEVHYINDPDRGKVWESTIVLLDHNIQLVMLSATVSKANEFAQWIANIKARPMNLITTLQRKVPLRHYIYNDNKIHMIMDDTDKYDSKTYTAIRKECDIVRLQREKKHKSKIDTNLISETVDFLNKKDMLPAIFFSFSRANCEKYANIISRPLIDHKERSEIDGIFARYMHKYEKQYETLPQYINIKQLLSNGIAYHHSGIIPIIKEIIEIIFQRGLIKVLFATETLAVGVDTPTKTVVLTELEKYTQKGKRFITTAEYKQLAGRSGRRGKDRNGFCIILPLYELPTEQELSAVLTGRIPHIQSKFRIDYQFLLKAIQSQTTNIKDFLKNSLYNKEHYEIKSSICKDIVVVSNIINTASIFSENELEIYQKLYQLENITSTSGTHNNIGIKIGLSRQQIKSIEKTKREIDVSKYKQFIDLEKHKLNLAKLEGQIEFYDNHASLLCNIIISFLKEIGYLLDNKTEVETVSYRDVSQKGIIAAHINDCNAILLTEMLMNNIFDDLEPAEIVAILAIFIDDAKHDEEISLEQIDGTDAIYDRLTKVNNIINKMQDLEKTYNIEENPDYWKISFNYVDIAYGWASGMSLHELKEYINGMTLYEGNFVKNMLKINNIAHTLKCLVTPGNKVELFPILETIEGLMIRDIVNVNSLYLS